MAKRKHKEAIEVKDDDVDLNPLIDVITMLIIFFIMGGKMSNDIRTEKITVPPTKTATKIVPEKNWKYQVINIFGDTQSPKGEPTYHLRIGTKEFESKGVDNLSGYQKLRHELDIIYAQADKMPDPLNTGLQLPKVLVELRADANTQYRVIQEVEQILTGTIDPNKDMQPFNPPVAPKDMKPFVHINFTSRKPTDRL